MNQSQHDQNQQIISRYVGQPARLPAELRARIEREWGACTTNDTGA